MVHLAAKCGHAEVTSYFIRKGVPIQMPNKEGAIALHEAVKQGHLNVVQALVSKVVIVMISFRLIANVVLGNTVKKHTVLVT